jgi:putative spermidine/putrescine transport system ATP-binding protein
MNAGRIEQLGTPDAVYARPATPFVMDFVGLSSQLAGTVESAADGLCRVRTAFGTVAAPGSFRTGAGVLVGLRPERAMLGGEALAAGRNRIVAQAPEVVYLGSRRMLHFPCSGDDRLLAEVSGDTRVPSGMTSIEWRIDETLLFPAAA